MSSGANGATGPAGPPESQGSKVSGATAVLVCFSLFQE